jgi:hypothetical protein
LAVAHEDVFIRVCRKRKLAVSRVGHDC